MVCPSCRTETTDKFCGNCGTPMPLQNNKNLQYERGNIVRFIADYDFGMPGQINQSLYAVVIDVLGASGNYKLTVVPIFPTTESADTDTRFVQLGVGLSEVVGVYARFLIAQFTFLANELDSIRRETQESKEKYKYSLNSYSTAYEIVNRYSDEAGDIMERFTDSVEFKDILDKFRYGSAACVGQITTIDSMRIMCPTKESDALFGLYLSESDMDEIDYYLKEMTR